jgi:hypothetical protein
MQEETEHLFDVCSSEWVQSSKSLWTKIKTHSLWAISRNFSEDMDFYGNDVLLSILVNTNRIEDTK